MRCNWRRWLWGLIPLVMVSWAATQVERGRIEHDLTERAKRSLAASGSPWASIAFNGRDANLSGRAAEDRQPLEAEAAVRGTWGVRAVDNNSVLPVKVEPFQWSARRRGSRIRLLGYVPDRSTRKTIIGMVNAALPGLDVVDRMSTARGVPAPDTWLAGLSFGLKQLALLKRGDVRLEGLGLTIAGEAEDAEAYRTLNAALKNGLPKGITLVAAQITPPVASPYTWSAKFAGGQLILAGHVVSESARAELEAAARSGPRGTKIVDRMEPAEGAPEGWLVVAAAVVKELTRLQSGSGEMKDHAVAVKGVAADEAELQAVRAALRASMPPAFKLSDHLRVREPPAPPPAPLPKLDQPPPAPKLDLPAAEPAAPPVAPPRQRAEALPESPTGAIGDAAKSEPRTAAAPPAPPQDAPPPAAPSPAAKAPVEPKQAAPAPVVPPRAEPAPPPPPPPQAASKLAAAPPPPAPAPAVDPCRQSLAKVTTSGHILFDSGSAALDAASRELLDRLAAAARSCAGLRIAVEGHTDTEGSARFNQQLSVRRARAVAAYLVAAGADARQLEAVGYGFTRPVAPNDTAENMAKNRRIEYVIRQ
jgi:outer membrane protein OmpA-like peptidoglycan-associated protein